MRSTLETFRCIKIRCDLMLVDFVYRERRFVLP